MKHLELQPRLQLIAELVPNQANIIDVGTDHGYIPVYLKQHGYIQKALATDIGLEPLNHAKQTAYFYNVNDIAFKACDGLNGVEVSEYDTIIIAGMGGETIISILSAAANDLQDSRHLFILQPMTKAELLRTWLNENGYFINEEKLVQDKKYLYSILLVKRGKQRSLTVTERICGVNNQKESLYKIHLDSKINSYSKALIGMMNSDNNAKAEEYNRILKELLKEREFI